MNNWNSKKRLQNALLEFMDEKSLTQSQAAEKLGTSQATISRIKNKQWERINSEVLKSIAKKLKVDLRPNFEIRSMPVSVIEKAVQDVWDGSEKHAVAIAKLIRAAQSC